MIEGGGRNLDCIMGNNQGDKMNYKNVIKYTIGLPLLLLYTMACFLGQLANYVFTIGNFLIIGEFKLDNYDFMEDVKKVKH